jgi:hypothetical protein
LRVDDVAERADEPAGKPAVRVVAKGLEHHAEHLGTAGEFDDADDVESHRAALPHPGAEAARVMALGDARRGSRDGPG